MAALKLGTKVTLRLKGRKVAGGRDGAHGTVIDVFPGAARPYRVRFEAEFGTSSAQFDRSELEPVEATSSQD